MLHGVKLMHQEELYKICLMCHTVYEGDIKKYNQDSKVSHGVCESNDCKSAYLTYALGCTKEDAESMLEEMLSKEKLGEDGTKYRF